MGWNPTTGAPILPEHDIELAFDVQFSVEDIVEVRPCVPLGVTAALSGSAGHPVNNERGV